MTTTACCRSRNWPVVRASVGVSDVVRTAVDRRKTTYLAFRSGGRLASRPRNFFFFFFSWPRAPLLKDCRFGLFLRFLRKLCCCVASIKLGLQELRYRSRRKGPGPRIFICFLLAFWSGGDGGSVEWVYTQANTQPAMCVSSIRRGFGIILDFRMSFGLITYIHGGVLLLLCWFFEYTPPVRCRWPPRGPETTETTLLLAGAVVVWWCCWCCCCGVATFRCVAYVERRTFVKLRRPDSSSHLVTSTGRRLRETQLATLQRGCTTTAAWCQAAGCGVGCLSV